MSDPARPAPTGPSPDLPPDADLITLPDVAELLGLPITKVHQLIRDGKLITVPDAQGRRAMPRIFVAAGSPLKGLAGVITLLRDGGYSDAEVVAWLLRADDTLPGTPAQALAENRGTEVKRRAQAAGF